MIQITRMGALLLIAIVLGFGAVPAVQAQGTADLALAKTLQADGPFFAGDPVVWILTLANLGPDDATNVAVTEDLSGLGEYTLGDPDASDGTTYTDPVWSVPVLASGSSVTLTLTTTLASDGEKTNGAAITAADQEDPNGENNEVSVSTGVSPSITAEIEVKPETLNLGSRGVFTVFIRFGEDYPLGEIELEKESLLCNGATPKKIHVNQKDGGTLMAKFRRQDLKVVEPDTEPGEDAATDEEATDGEGTLTITCEGTILSGEETVKFTGSDTVRVTGEKKKGLDAFLAGFLDTVLPVDDETEDATDEDATTSTATPTPGQKPALNRGQLKKGAGDGTCTGDCSVAETPGSQGNGKKSGTADDDSVTGSQGNGKKAGTSDDSTVTGSQGKGNQGNGNGQGNSNRPEKENSNGRK
ncbi:MAG: DUF11 domain-containing protein [Methanomicrobiales archaeon]|nr:DUF11 domain-containing protein [Methanomicrobiales archaeon]